MGKRKNRYYTQNERLAILKAYDNSGMVLSEFCEQIGVNKRTASNWMKNRKQKTGKFAPQSESHQPFVSLPVATHQRDTVLPSQQPKNCQQQEQEQEQQSSSSSSQHIILKRNGWVVEIPTRCERTEVYQILSVLEDLYAV